MAILSQLIPTREFLALSEDQLDTLYSLVEAEAMKNPEFMKHLTNKFQKDILPAMPSSQK